MSEVELDKDHLQELDRFLSETNWPTSEQSIINQRIHGLRLERDQLRQQLEAAVAELAKRQLLLESERNKRISLELDNEQLNAAMREAREQVWNKAADDLECSEAPKAVHFWRKGMINLFRNRAKSSTPVPAMPIQDDKWISVDEKWPDPEQGNKIIAYGSGYVFECEFDEGFWCNIGGEKFTHWMPYFTPKSEVKPSC